MDHKELEVTLSDDLSTVTVNGVTYIRELRLNPGDFVRCINNSSDFGYEDEIYMVVDREDILCIFGSSQGESNTIRSVKEESHFWQSIEYSEVVKTVVKTLAS